MVSNWRLPSIIFMATFLTCVAKKYSQLFPSKKEKTSKKKEDKPPVQKKAPKEVKPNPEEDDEDEPQAREPKFKDPYIDLPKRLDPSITVVF